MSRMRGGMGAAMDSGPAIVGRYFDALVAHRWEDVAATLASHVVRLGPYQDDIRGRDEYIAFLRATFEWMQDYEMEIARVWGDDTRVCAELAETVTLDSTRLRTEEAIVFELADGCVTQVAVYLRRSTRAPAS